MHWKLWPPPVPGLVLLAAVLSISSAARAQTGAALLVKPWPDKNEFFDGSANAYLSAAGHTSEGARFQLFDYESEGRFRVLPGNEISPRVGFDLTYLDNHTRRHGLPDQLTDVSAAFGTGIAKWDSWVAGITLGVGYAGSSAFDVGSAWYGKSDLILARELNDQDVVAIAIDYNGNRTYFPDVPLPGIGWSHRFDPTLMAVIGVPFASVEWKPLSHFVFGLEYELLKDFKVSLGYEFIPKFTAYGRFDYVRDAFHVGGFEKDHRLLFYEQRVEGGVRFAPDAHFTFKVGIGYTWDASYRVGGDFRKDETVTGFSDRPYLRLGMNFQY